MHNEWGERQLKYKKAQTNQKVQDAGRMARNAYLRDWRANNRDKVRQYNRDYWERKAERKEAGA